MQNRRPPLIRLLRQPKGSLGLRALPNLLTVAAMLCGFFAIVRAMAGDLPTACLFVLIASVLDGLDGKVARMASAESEIGQQYDSLADMVSFGVAPAAVLYSWAAPYASGPAMICSSIFLSCVGLRLARFNIGGQEQGGPFYRGLPTPAGACGLCGTVWLDSLSGAQGGNWLILGGGLAASLMLSGLMISRFKYYKFQTIRSPNNQTQNILSLMMAVAVFGFLLYRPALATFLLACGYTSSGLIRPATTRLRRLFRPAKTGSDREQRRA